MLRFAIPLLFGAFMGAVVAAIGYSYFSDWEAWVLSVPLWSAVVVLEPPRWPH